MMDPFLAIIIPAYKSAYLKDTLVSLFEQEEKNFSVYIGDDGSNENLYEIINPFCQIMNITYVRFEENVGKHLLPMHWNRCFELLKNEEWIWLFSDDDIADPKCVKNFKAFVSKHPQCKLFKFNSIKFRNNEILKKNLFPTVINTADFLKLKLGYVYESYAIEYIFHRTILNENKFPLFPLGWCSDDLFWLKSSLISEIYTIPEAFVYWRYSDDNISGRKNDKQSSLEKLNACLMFLNILFKTFSRYIDLDIYKLAKSWFTLQYKYLSKNLSVIARFKIKILYVFVFTKGLIRLK